MLSGIVVAILGLIGTVFGLWVKYLRKPSSPAKEVEKINEAMLNAATNRPDSSAAVDRLRDGTG